jgi:hypothetical protein
VQGTNDLPCLFQVIIELSRSGQRTINKYFRQAIDLVRQLIQHRQGYPTQLGMAHELMSDNGPLGERDGHIYGCPFAAGKVL